MLSLCEVFLESVKNRVIPRRRTQIQLDEQPPQATAEHREIILPCGALRRPALATSFHTFENWYRYVD
jgi:hypothetical protein